MERKLTKTANPLGYIYTAGGTPVLAEYKDWRQAPLEDFTEQTRDECFALACEILQLGPDGTEATYVPAAPATPAE